MSDEEKRAIQGQVLLEVEEARSALAHLRAKAELWRKKHEKIGALLATMGRSNEGAGPAAAAARDEVESDRDALSAVCNVEAILSLDGEIEKAIERLRKAEAEKRSLGFVD